MSVGLVPLLLELVLEVAVLVCHHLELIDLAFEDVVESVDLPGHSFPLHVSFPELLTHAVLSLLSLIEFPL